MIQNNIYIFIDCFEAVIILIYLESDKNVIAQIAKKFQIFHWLDTKKSLISFLTIRRLHIPLNK